MLATSPGRTGIVAFALGLSACLTFASKLTQYPSDPWHVHQGQAEAVVRCMPIIVRRHVAQSAPAKRFTLAKMPSSEASNLHVDHADEANAPIFVRVARTIPEAFLHHGNAKVAAIRQPAPFGCLQRGADLLKR